ncbi:MAG TPA: peptidase, partial [Bacteroidota bacterium]|nr:peptidase [Bacteroidota bacterium]
RLTVTTLACMMTGIPLRTANDLMRDEGISADFTRARWPELGHPDVRPVSPREAGHHLWQLASKFDFTLFEYWLTDVAGHSQKMDTAIDALEKFDGFLEGFLELFEPANALLITISDHGNIEDLSTKSHTRNPVPCIAAGAHRKEFVNGIRNLTHLTPSILNILSNS